MDHEASYWTVAIIGVGCFALYSLYAVLWVYWWFKRGRYRSRPPVPPLLHYPGTDYLDMRRDAPQHDGKPARDLDQFEVDKPLRDQQYVHPDHIPIR